MRIIFSVICMIFISSVLFADSTFEVKTGYGYFLDSDGHIYCKYNLPNGKHPIKDGYTAVETSKEEFDNVVVYKKPKTNDELKEEKIQAEMKNLAREQAIKSLKDKGEI